MRFNEEGLGGSLTEQTSREVFDIGTSDALNAVAVLPDGGVVVAGATAGRS